MDKKSKVALILALLISCVIATAAVGKIFFPQESLRIFEFSVGIIEVIFIILLLAYRKKWESWLLFSLIFAVWSGYAFYWMKVELPCGCLGTMIEFPPAISFSVDSVFWGIAIAMSAFLGATLKSIKIACLGAVFLGIGGYWAGCLIHSIQ